MLLIVSLVFVLVKMDILLKKTDQYGKKVPISKNDRNRLNEYKGILIADISLTISIIIGNMLSITYGKDWFTILEYILFTFVYGLSPYLVYLSSNM
jgi:hypothetical protein